MIKFNNSDINDWNFDNSNIIKVYHNGAVCYYKITGGGDTPTAQTPCFAVVDDISQYSDTEFEDVFNKADEKWYKLNNLNQYEQYGIYGSGRTITYYEGKLTIDGDYEYMYSGSSWVNVGEVSGSTATLPNVPFVLNYNAQNYDATTHTISMTSGQLNTVNAVKQYGANVVDHSEDGYISVTGNTRFVTTGGTTSIARNDTQTGCTMTIVSKARATSGEAILTNRGSNGTNQMNWMWRYPTDGIFLHGSSSYSSKQYSVDTTTSPIIASVKTYYDGGVKQTLKDWTNNGGYSGNFGYGSSYNGGSMFCDYLTYNDEYWQGDFYWVYMSQEVLTDEQVQQVIDYNESGGGQSEYPLYYDEKADPPDNLVFTSMVEAESYECPWVGMRATIAGSAYTFNENYEWELNTEIWVNAQDTIASTSGSDNVTITSWVTNRKFPKKITINKNTSGDGSWCWGGFKKTDGTSFLDIPTSTEMYFTLEGVSYQLSNPSSFPSYVTYENGILTIDLEAANLYGSVYFSHYQKNFLVGNVNMLFTA